MSLQKQSALDSLLSLCIKHLGKASYAEICNCLDNLQTAELTLELIEIHAAALFHVGRTEEAARRYQYLSSARPLDAKIQNNLGLCNVSAGQLSEALKIFRSARRLDRSYLEPVVNTADVYLSQGKLSVAQRFYRVAIKGGYKTPRILNNLGLCCSGLNQFEEAELQYRGALVADPNYYEATINLGALLDKTSRATEAEAQYIRAALIDNKRSESYFNLANMKRSQRRFDDAISLYDQALSKATSENQISSIRLNRGGLFEAIGCYQSALDEYRAILSISPNNTKALSNLCFCSNYSMTDSNATIAVMKHSQAYGANTNIAGLPDRRGRSGKRRGRIRLGFVSGDLRSHPVSYFLQPVLANAQGKEYELYVYDSTENHDDTTAWLRSYRSTWRELSTANDSSFHRVIKADEIDLLFDLSGHTAHNRLAVFARRAADIQLSWMGYFNTTGLAQMDYMVTNEHSSSTLSEHARTEKLLSIDPTHMSFSLPPWLQPRDFVTQGASGRIRYGYLGKLSKLNQSVIKLWSSLLSRSSGTELLIRSDALHSRLVAQGLLHRFQELGIDSNRVILEPSLPYLTHLQSYCHIDVILDTFPYSGGTTSAEALYMGVPVISLDLNIYQSRLTGSFLKTLGMADLIAKNYEEYIEKAIEVGNLVRSDASYKRSVIESFTESMLGNGEKFAKAFYSKCEFVFNSGPA
jgi:protein O-GlcNAc transferase